MENAELVRSYCERKGIRPVPICGIDEFPLVLDGADGRRYTEVRGNVWMDVAGEGDVAYVGTSRHGGHITLRPLFVKIDGGWRNATTGEPSDFGSWKTAR